MIFLKKPKKTDFYYYLLDYHPWDCGANPNFRVSGSGLVLDLKDGLEGGIAYFAKELEPYLSMGFALARVPSSDPAKIENGVTELARRLCQGGRIDGTLCLVRHTQVQKLATGGDRAIDVHLKSIRVEKKGLIAKRDVLLLDDVTTTGNSLAACRKLLLDGGAKSVECLAIARTYRATK